MDLFKQIFVDSLNGFSLRFLPLFIFQLLVAGLLGHLFQKIVNRKFGNEIVEYAGLMALSLAVLASIVKYSLPFAVLSAVLVLFLVRKKEGNFLKLLALFIVGLIGVGCGIGSVFQVTVGFVFIVTVILFIPIKK